MCGRRGSGRREYAGRRYAVTHVEQFMFGCAVLVIAAGLYRTAMGGMCVMCGGRAKHKSGCPADKQ